LEAIPGNIGTDPDFWRGDEFCFIRIM
jgi:hypothetical protein